MKHYPFHLKFLIALTFILGLAAVFYEIVVLHIPVTKQQSTKVWTIDAKIELPVQVKSVKAKMFLPSQYTQYKRIFEAFVPQDAFGQRIDSEDDNRFVTLSARRNSDTILYYRTMLALDEAMQTERPPAGAEFREPIKLDGIEKAAADAIINVARSKSTDVETIITQVIKQINDARNSADVKVLMKSDFSNANKIRVVELVLSQARIAVDKAHTINLDVTETQQPESWLTTYVNNEWLYFNPNNGKTGLPNNRLVWWTGENELISLSDKRSALVSFTVKQGLENRLSVLRQSDIEVKTRDVLEFSFYNLPLDIQNKFFIMLMIPFGVLVVLVLRNLIGFSTLGTFTPVLIALAFRETTLVTGIILFSSITVLGLLLRAYLESLKLQMLPRLSIVLTFVVAFITFMGLFSYKLGIQSGLSMTLFPMVILTMTIERMSITWEERGANETIKVAFGTLLAASLAYFLMNLEPLSYFVFTFPASLLILVSFMLVMGRYRGYRLFELFRFKALEKE